MTSASLIAALVNGCVVGSIYAMVAMGFVIIYKTTRVINFAQGELLMVGAYICLSMTVHYQMPFWLSFLMTGVFSAVLGFTIERVLLRNVIGESVISIIMITLGLSIVLRSIVGAVFGVTVQVMPSPLPKGAIEVAGVPISYEYLASIALSLLAMCLFGLFFKMTRLGLAMRATASDQQAAMAMGVNVGRIFAYSWAIACVVSAMGGVLIALSNGVNIGLSIFGLKVFPAVILGGLDSIVGAAVGGVLIGMIENVADGVFKSWFDLNGFRDVAAFVVLVLVLMVRPYGLFGQRDVERI